jgi:DNA-binding response OmpR family regulator
LVLESQGYEHISRSEAREIARWQMHEIRKLLEPDPRQPRLIITVRDVGYRLIV